MLKCNGLITVVFNVNILNIYSISISININEYNLYKQKLFMVFNNLIV